MMLCCPLLLGASVVVRADTVTDGVTDVQTKVKNAINVATSLSTNPDTAFADKINLGIAHLNKANNELSNALQTHDSSEGSDEGVRQNLELALASITKAITELNGARDMAKKNDTKEAVSNVLTILSASSQSLKTLMPPRDDSARGRNGETKGDAKADDATLFANLFQYVTPTLIGLVTLTTLGLLIYSIISFSALRRSTDDLIVSLPKYFGAVKVRHEELGKQLAAFAVVNSEIKQRLTDLHGEVRQVGRGLQLSQQNARGSMSQAGAPPAPSYAEAAPDKRDEMPSFPIAADDFLRRMQPKAMVVKRDFQNDILVSDPDGKGELVLIRDARIPDEVQPLFIVPRVTQFQMRQEYYNFYEKYYDCTNPESGAVWILDPAVVDKVSGGWQLREKGRLEVR
jgi:hypothetical protein